MSAIEAEDLRKTYKGGVEALRGVSFAVHPGEVFALVGPNGAGKTTTVRILTTLTAPSAGAARVAGCDVRREPREVRRRIGCVAQASGADVNATGREDLIFQGRLHHLSATAAAARARELLAAFDLEGAADRLVRTWSGGMKRRLDVAMGLVHAPRVLFLDEPTTGLDPESRATLWEQVRRLADGGVTVLLTTHYLEEADRLARHVAIVDQGRIVAAGTPEELKRALHGDRVRVDLADPARLAEARRELEGLEGVVAVIEDQGRLFAQAEDGARIVPRAVAALERVGIAVAEIALSRPTLDDVYLDATGRTFAAADDAAPVVDPRAAATR